MTETKRKGRPALGEKTRVLASITLEPAELDYVSSQDVKKSIYISRLIKADMIKTAKKLSKELQES